MRIRTLAVPAAALMFAVGGATLTNALPGPNGDNTFGLCTAYFAGSERGQEMRRQAPPFAGLEAAAEAEDMTVAEYCAENGTHPATVVARAAPRAAPDPRCSSAGRPGEPDTPRGVVASGGLSRGASAGAGSTRRGTPDP